ncbi:hypothetical protein D3C71_683050 [compost metagenome]
MTLQTAVVQRLHCIAPAQWILPLSAIAFGDEELMRAPRRWRRDSDGVARLFHPPRGIVDVFHLGRRCARRLIDGL